MTKLPWKDAYIFIYNLDLGLSSEGNSLVLRDQGWLKFHGVHNKQRGVGVIVGLDLAPLWAAWGGRGLSDGVCRVLTDIDDLTEVAELNFVDNLWCRSIEFTRGEVTRTSCSIQVCKRVMITSNSSTPNKTFLTLKKKIILILNIQISSSTSIWQHM